jgi:acylphosphatase
MDVIFQVVIRGSVQGIGFRARTEITALELGVEGWVRNCRDGTVEALSPRARGAALAARARGWCATAPRFKQLR